MANVTRNPAGIIAIMTVVAVFPASAESMVNMAVLVENHAGLNPEPLVESQRRVSQIYEAIGIKLVWVSADEADVAGAQREARSVRVLLLSAPMAARKIHVERIRDGVLAQAIGASGRAYIFMDRIRIAAERYSRDFSTVLSLVVAHEIGHLLLPVNGHSKQGIMQDNVLWQRTDSRFTEPQARVIRDRLAAEGER